MPTTHDDRRDIARVLNRSLSRYTRGDITLTQHGGTYTWITPAGVGTSHKWEDALAAIIDYLA